MPKLNGFHHRQRIIPARLNDIEARIPILVSATSEELCQPSDHFNLTEEEKTTSRLQLLIKKGKMFAYNDKKPTTKVSGLASHRITIFSKMREISPMSIMQNEQFSSFVKEKTHTYLQRVLNAPKQSTTHLESTVDSLYQIIKKSSPSPYEVIHLATMERDLAEPESGKNRLTAEFSLLLLTKLREKIALNNDLWTVELDRVLSLKQRTSRAESYGIHRIAQQALMLYQSRTIEEQISPGEKVIVVDDHIQAGSAMYSATEEIMDNHASLLSIVCISAHKNNLFFNIQQDVKDAIINLLPNRLANLSKLNEILALVGLNILTLTNVEGMILIAILSDSENEEHRQIFENIIIKYDASACINHPLFQNQNNSLIEEFNKPKVAFENLRSELLIALDKGRYTVPYEKQTVLSDEDGENIRKEINARENLPWLLFDFDDTLHYLQDGTFIHFQNIIKRCTGLEISLETIKHTRAKLKSSGKYEYQQMLLDFIQPDYTAGQINFEDMTKMYEKEKMHEPFRPTICREDFLYLRDQYRIGIITDGSTFESKIPKIREYYGVDIDGYIHHQTNFKKKPSLDMFHQFCTTYNIKEKPIAYVGDNSDLDGNMARNANINFIQFNPSQSIIDMREFIAELNRLSERRTIAKKRWETLFKHHFLIKATETNCSANPSSMSTTSHESFTASSTDVDVNHSEQIAEQSSVDICELMDCCVIH